MGGGVCSVVLLSLPSAGHVYTAASSSERREPRLDRGGLRLGERVAEEGQRLQRRQRRNRVGKCHERTKRPTRRDHVGSNGLLPIIAEKDGIALVHRQKYNNCVA